MIAGIRKLWIALYSDLLTKGYSVNNNRLNLFVKNGWTQIEFSRDTAQLSSINKINFYSNQLKYSHFNATTSVVDFAKKLHNKRIIAVATLDNGSDVIIGAENPLMFTFKYNTGSNAFDGIGYSAELNSNSKIGIELFDITKLPVIINSAKWINKICVKEEYIAPDVTIYNAKWLNFVCVKELYTFNLYLSKLGVNPGGVFKNPSGPYVDSIDVSVYATENPPTTGYFNRWEIKDGLNWILYTYDYSFTINISDNTYLRAVYISNPS